MLGRKRYILVIVTFLLMVLIVFAFSESGSEPSVPESEPVTDDQVLPEIVREYRLLEPGTARETTLHIITSSEAGPTIMIMGGVHGDEPAGYLAADIITSWALERGTLLVLPRANVPAIETGTRFPPGMFDLNASFPGSAAGNSTERIAASIYQVMEEFRPEWVVDLHEAQEFERVQYSALGQTIIYPHDGLHLAVVEEIIERLNRIIPEELHQYQIKRGGVKGGTILASRSLDLETFTVETTRKLPLDDRINQHLHIVRLLLSILEINLIE